MGCGSQFVSVPGIEDRIWKVAVGSGMGLFCSGEVSDMTFYNKVESGFLDNQSVSREY